MDIKQQYIAYFSATNKTKTLVRRIAKEIALPIKTEYNITKSNEEYVVMLTSFDLFILGVPSYAGRVPKSVVSAINQFKGKDTPAILVCSYGNRDYDDTLLELKDIVAKNGFKVIAAGAFVSQHSIFPGVAASRPDTKDNKERSTFAKYAVGLLEKISDISSIQEIVVRGNFPYRKTGNIPLKPKGDSKCNKCGTCVRLCPTDAIPMDNPQITDESRCISCVRCIAVCSQKSRKFRGLKYKIASYKFTKDHTKTSS